MDFLQYSVATTVQKIKWGSMFNGQRTNICKSTSEVPWFLTHDSYSLMRRFQIRRWITFPIFYNLEPKHLQNALWSCQNGMKTFHFHFRQKSISILVNHSLSKVKSTLPLAALSIPPELRVATTVSKILPRTLAYRGSAFSYTQQQQAF